MVSAKLQLFSAHALQNTRRSVFHVGIPGRRCYQPEAWASSKSTVSASRSRADRESTLFRAASAVLGSEKAAKRYYIAGTIAPRREGGQSPQLSSVTTIGLREQCCHVPSARDMHRRNLGKKKNARRLVWGNGAGMWKYNLAAPSAKLGFGGGCG